MNKIGFIGLGIMGKPMAKNLLKKGCEVTVYARRPEPARERASQVEVVITMLPNSPEVKEVALGKDGVIDGTGAGLIVVDMSSIAPRASQGARPIQERPRRHRAVLRESGEGPGATAQLNC